MTEPPNETLSLKALIHDFIQNRFATKTEKLASDDPAYLKLQEQFAPQTWLADAARRVSQLQVVTHSLKAIHPDAKGTNLYVESQQLSQKDLVGSQCLPQDFEADVVGNAAALDVYALLKMEWHGRTLLELALEQDSTLLEALSKDRGEAEEWLAAFANIVEPKGAPSSHTRGKQVYWLIGDNPAENDAYHILAPLYATALTHCFYSKVSPNTWFYGDYNKEARRALKNKTAFEGGYIAYPNLAVQKMGGSNQQNVSRLNKTRNGSNYLLASLPPHWQSRDIYPPMREAFRAFKRRPNAWKTLYELKRFLETDPAKNMHTRDLRDDFTAMLVDELTLFTFDMHSLAPGWTTDKKCELVAEEKFWLDPGRADIDADFDQARRQSNWHEVISDRAAGWLNHELSYKSKLSMGDPQYTYWQKQVGAVIEDFHRQLEDLQDALRDDDEGLEGEPT